MNFILALCFAVFGFTQSQLPKKFNIQSMDLKPIPYAKRFTLKASFEIPKGYKGGQYSKLNVYEKIKGEWVLSQEIKEKNLSFMRKNNTIEFEDVLRLKSADSEVAMDLSVNFCNKICVINNFQEIVSRHPKANKRLILIKLKGFLPQEKIKKEFRTVTLKDLE